jgi:large subunit ribosomal protein L12
MEYVYAAMLLHSAGTEVTEAAVKKVLQSAGVKPDGTRLKALVASLDGVNIEEAIASAAAVPVGAAPAPAAGPAPAAESAPAPEPEEEEDEDDEEVAGLGALFG